ncbi:InlB B-repeat-containing protein, partial [Candidatus Symbiothrix dinenymphae]|uniref:InlB B-repeat-containing protein n=1 Tax=Candidatus Symbiothrix dinenymphae TaxID=467085 RepID=UPI000ACE5F9B
TYTSQAHKTAAWVNIYYEPNSGVGSTITQTVAYGVAATTPVATVFSRPGYTIDAWAPNADGSGTTVNPNASYTNTGSITFYAKWKGNAKVARSAKVKVGSTAGANDYAATSLITPGTTVYLTASNDSVGYDFDSWSGVTSIEV